MEMFPHSEYMVEFHGHWKSGSSHVALAASIVEQMYVLLVFCYFQAVYIMLGDGGTSQQVFMLRSLCC